MGLDTCGESTCECRDQVVQNLEIEILALGINYISPERHAVGVATRDALENVLGNREVQFSGCVSGQWNIQFSRGPGTTDVDIVVDGTECSSFHIRTVETCSADDHQCSIYNCGAGGVDRLENELGEFVYASYTNSPTQVSAIDGYNG